jgi:16S rRNA (guanine527-N7)-methyltransferase
MMDKIIAKYFPDLTADQYYKIAELGEVYREWNNKINVISRKDIDYFYERHVLHSLGIAKVFQFEADTRILDVGTGGGFPGIPLAILFPESQFHLVDSIAKKIKVVDNAVAALNLKNVTTQQIRVEDLTEQYDFTVSRAVARMISFYRWVQKQVKSGGNILYLKGGNITEEMQELNRPYEIFDLKDYFEEEFFETKKLVQVKC